MKTARPITCEHCGGEQPWARKPMDWFYDGQFHFCSEYCAFNYQAFLLRMALKGNRHTREGILSGKMVLPEHKLAMEADMQAQLDKHGDSRTLYIPKGWITLDKIKKKVRFDITDEMFDDQRRLNTLATALGQLPPGDPQRSAIVAEMMEIGGVSSASFPVNAAAPAPAPMVASKPTRTNEVLPAGQKV